MQGTLSAVRGNAGRGNQGGLSGGGEVALDFRRMRVAGKGMAGGNDVLLSSRRPHHVNRRNWFFINLPVSSFSFGSSCLCLFPVSLLSSLTLFLVQTMLVSFSFWKAPCSPSPEVFASAAHPLPSVWNRPCLGNSSSSYSSQMKSHFQKEALPDPLVKMESPCTHDALHSSLSLGTPVTLARLQV